MKAVTMRWGFIPEIIKLAVSIGLGKKLCKKESTSRFYSSFRVNYMNQGRQEEEKQIWKKKIQIWTHFNFFFHSLHIFIEYL